MKKIARIPMLLMACAMVLMAASGLSVRVNVNNANVRSRPDLKAAIVLKAAKGDVFTVSGKEGDWYKIILPAEAAGQFADGFIHSGVVDVLTIEPAPEKNTPAKAAARPARTSPAASRPALKSEKLFSGFYTKFGYMTKPAGSFGNRWLLDLGSDWGINPFLAVGFELQPYYRHLSQGDASDNTLGANLFANAKGGVNMGRFEEKLKFLTPYIGFGLGGAFNFSSSRIGDEKESRFDFNFAWHLMFGIEFVLKNISLVMEFQVVKVSIPELNPDLSQYFWMIGARF